VTADERRRYQEMVEHIESNFAADEAVTAVLIGLEQNLPAREIQEAFSVTETQYDSARKSCGDSSTSTIQMDGGPMGNGSKNPKILLDRSRRSWRVKPRRCRTRSSSTKRLRSKKRRMRAR